MNTIKIKNGYRIEMTEAEYIEYREEYLGICMNCGSQVKGCEPDMIDGPCESCDNGRAYGIEELLITDQIKIID